MAAVFFSSLPPREACSGEWPTVAAGVESAEQRALAGNDRPWHEDALKHRRELFAQAEDIAQHASPHEAWGTSTGKAKMEKTNSQSFLESAPSHKSSLGRTQCRARSFALVYL